MKSYKDFLSEYPYRPTEKDIKTAVTNTARMMMKHDPNSVEHKVLKIKHAILKSHTNKKKK